jgi:hypothetical protein
LTLWFNLVSGHVNAGTTLAELCPGPASLPACIDPSTTIAELIVIAESGLLAPDPDAALLCYKDAVDFVDNAASPAVCLN